MFGLGSLGCYANNSTHACFLQENKEENLKQALAIAEQGIATKEDIDKAMITGRNWPAAFFGSRGGIGKEW